MTIRATVDSEQRGLHSEVGASDPSDGATLRALLRCLRNATTDELGLLAAKRCEAIEVVEQMLRTGATDVEFISFLLHFAPGVKRTLSQCTPQSSEADVCISHGPRCGISELTS